MDNVSFQEEEEAFRPTARAARSGKSITGYLIAHGWVKDEKGANMLLLIVAGICILLAIGISVFSAPPKPKTSPLDRPPGFPGTAAPLP
jgi:hypothetical protein